MQANQLVLSAAGCEAIKRFRDSKPWRGTFEERLAKFETFHDELADACGFTTKFEFVGEEDTSRPGNGGYDSTGNRVMMIRKLSVVTMLFTLGVVGGLRGREAMEWSCGLFRHYFPRSFGRCQMVGGMLLNGGR